MPAATAITSLDRPGALVQQLTFALTPGSIAAAGTELETVALPGVIVGDQVAVSPQSGLQNGLVIGHCRVSAAGVVTFSIVNVTAGALTPTAGTWTLTIIRGTTGAVVR